MSSSESSFCSKIELQRKVVKPMTNSDENNEEIPVKNAKIINLKMVENKTVWESEIFQPTYIDISSDVY